MTAPYLLTTAAEDDLRGIIRYTRKQWGDAQAQSYVTRLEKGIVRAATGESLSRDVSGLHPGLCVVHCEHHYIFCLPRENKPLLIIAIFHERMDLMTRVGAQIGLNDRMKVSDAAARNALRAA